MNLSRWKLLAGVFGISVCGLAALAEPACRTVGQANRQDAPADEAKPKGMAEAKPKAAVTPHVEVPPPALVELPVPITAPVPAIIPPISEPDAKPVGPPMPVKLAPVPPMANHDVPPAVAPAPTPVQFSAPVPLPSVVDPIAVPAPKPSPEPAFTLDGSRTQEQADKMDREQAARNSAAKITPVSAVAPSDKKLKVSLQMDEGDPKFEVRDGDEIVLKVVSSKVDVTSPTQKGERWSTLKACGQVKFMTPGGDGHCDALQVVPGTGEMVATGNVRFTYNWGKVETSATAEKMNFRLGTQPAPAR